MVHTANIAEVKNHLSKFLQLVKNGEEIIIRDRNLPVAKLTPVSPAEASAGDLALVAGGELALPRGPFDEAAFWSIGKDVALRTDLRSAAAGAVSDDREERDAGILGR